MPTVKDLLLEIDRLCVVAGAEAGDCADLQVAPSRNTVRLIRLALSPTPRVVAAAVREGADVLITYDSLIDEPLRSLDAKDPTGKGLLKLANAGCALISLRSALDASPFAPNRLFADLLDARVVAEFRESVIVASSEVKLAVFVPLGHEAAIIGAIAEGGGGIIGRYSHCTFRSPGTGTYMPMDGAKPWAGEVGRFEEAQETRLEARVPRGRLAEVMRRVRAAHPYEEMAYDLYPLEELRAEGRVGGMVAGLPSGMTAKEIRRRIAVAKGEALDETREVGRVGLCIGGERAIVNEVVAGGAEVVIGDSVEVEGVRVMRVDGAAARALAMRRVGEELRKVRGLRSVKVVGP